MATVEIQRMARLAKGMAHSPGRTSLLCLSKERVATAGSDGEIVVHSWNSEALSLEPLTHRRIHKGAINEMVALPALRAATIADDGCLYRSELVSEGITFQLLHRATLPLRLLTAHSCTDGRVLLATYGDELKIEIINDDGTRIASQAMQKPVIVVEADGIVRKMATIDGGLSPSKQIDLKTTMCDDRHGALRIFSSPTALLLCSPVNGLFVLSMDNLRFLNHIRPVNSDNFICAKVSDSLLLMAHARGICTIDCVELSCSDDYQWQEMGQDESLISMATLDHNQPLFWTTTEGNLGCSSLVLRSPLKEHPKLVAKPVSTQVIAKILDSEAEESENLTTGIGRKKGKRKKGTGAKKQRHSKGEASASECSEGGSKEEEFEDVIDFGKDNDDDYGLDSYDVDDDVGSKTMDVEGKKMDSVVLGTDRFQPSLPSSRHASFSPGSTPFVGNYRYMAWNGLGSIVSRQDEGYWSIEVEFSDKNFHHPIRFIDETGFTMAALGKAGAVFASSGSSTIPSRVYISPLTTWAKIVPFTMDLPEAETALGVAIGAGKLAVIATNAGYLRTISINGLQGPIVNYPGIFVSMVASDHYLMLLSTEVYSSRLSVTFYHMDGNLRLIGTSDLGGRFHNKRVTWLGFAAELGNGSTNAPSAGVFDEDQILHICHRPVSDMMNLWQPWSIQRKEHQKFWPVSFTAADVAGIVLDEEDTIGEGNDSYPEVVPRPMLTIHPLVLPLMELATNELVASFEQSYRTRLILETERDVQFGIRTEKETKRMQLAADKHVLELIQLAIKADRLTRVLELCEFFLLERSWDLAIQLVRHQRLTSLANRIEELRDSMKNQNMKGEICPIDTATIGPISAIHTPKAILRAAATESPATVLANLTPSVSNGTGLDGVDMNQESSFVFKDTLKGGTATISLETPPITAPLAKLSFKHVSLDARSSAEALPARSIVDILKSVEMTTTAGGASLANGNDKKRVAHEPASSAVVPPTKAKKRTDLSVFRKVKSQTPTVSDENQPWGHATDQC